MIPALLDILLDLLWRPISSLRPAEILMILLFGLVTDVGWGFIARLVGALKERQGMHRNHREKRREYLQREIDRLTAMIRVRDEKQGESLEDLERLWQSERLTHGRRESIVEEQRFGERRRVLERLEAEKSELVRLREEREAARSELDNLVTEIKTLDKEASPLVSLIVPCHNSEDLIEETLKSLTGLEYEHKQIIVVDDASVDHTYDLANRYSDKVTVVRRATSTGRKTGATNYGLNFATANTIVVVDDDTILRPNALTNMIAALADKNVAAVAGNVKVKATRNSLLARLQSAEYLVSMELGRPFQNAFYGGLFVISGCFGAFRREILEKIGQYDIDIITEDLDITWKIYKLRKTVVYSRNAVCHTDAPTSLSALVRQRMRWDKGLFEVLSKHRNSVMNPRFGYVGLFLLPDTLFTEVVLLLMRPLWIVSLILEKYPILPVLLLTVYLYLCLEFASIFTAGVLSDNKRDALKAFYAPLMFVYRQFSGLIRLVALAFHLSGKKMRW